MPYPELRHLQWAKRLDATLNLAGSTIPTPPPVLLGLDRKHFPAARPKERDPWYLPRLERGDARLQELVGARYGVDPARVVPVAGASEAHFLVQMLVRGRDGGDALVERPGYGPHDGVARAFAGEVLALPRDARGRLDLSVLESPTTSRVKVVTLSDPHNPTGMPLDPSDLAVLVHWGDQRRAQIVVDEVFREADPSREPGTWAAVHPHRVWSVSSLTKSFGLGPLRIGWAIAPADWSEALRRIQDYTTVLAPGPSVALARPVLERADAVRAFALGALAPNRAHFQEHDGWACVGTTAFVRLAVRRGGAWADSGELCAALLREHGLAVVPGAFFGDASGFRIGFGAEKREFKKGWALVRRAVRKHGFRIVPPEPRPEPAREPAAP